MVLETNMKLCVTELDFPEIWFLLQKLGNGPKMDQKHGFLNLLKNAVIHFYWIWSIMKIYIICCVPAQISYLGKFWFMRYGPKYYQPIRLQDFLINSISRTNQWNSLIKSGSNIFWVGMVRNGCGQSGHRTLKSAVSQEWNDGMNWFLAYWCKFKKAKSYSNDFWVDLVKNGCSHFMRPQNLQNDFMDWADFFACWLWCNNFLLDQDHTFYLWHLNASLLWL